MKQKAEIATHKREVDNQCPNNLKFIFAKIKKLVGQLQFIFAKKKDATPYSENGIILLTIKILILKRNLLFVQQQTVERDLVKKIT